MLQDKKKYQLVIPSADSIPAISEPTSPPLTTGDVQNIYDRHVSEIRSSVTTPVVSTITPVLQFLSRGQYASAKFFDTFKEDSLGSFVGALQAAGSELVNPKERMSFKDVIQKNNPKFVQENPTASSVIGFLGDVFFDPLSYLGIGLGKEGLAIGGRALTKEGTKVLSTGLKLVENERKYVQLADKIKDIDKFVRANGFQIEQNEIEKIAKEELVRESKQAPPAFLKEVKRISDNTFQARTPELQEFLQNSDNVLFENLKSQIPKDGQSGLSISRVGDKAFVVERSKNGTPQGILKIFLNESGQPIQQSIAVSESKKGIGTRLWNYAKAQGLDIDASSGASKYSTEGAQFALARARKQFQLNSVFDPVEVYDTTENRIARFTALDKTASLKLLKEPGVRVTVGFPLGQQYDVLGTGYLGKAIDNLGNKLKATIGESKLVAPLGRVFSKEYDPSNSVPKEWWDALHQIENTFDTTTYSVARTISKDIKDIPEARLKNIGELMADIRDKSYLQEKSLGRPLTDIEAANIKQTILSGANLDPKEFAFVSQMYHDYAKFQQLEMQAKLLDHSVTNYSPRNYIELKDPTKITDLLKNKYNTLSTNLPSSKNTKYETLAQAIADGNTPELNAAVLYAQRMINHQERLATANFNQATRDIFGLQGTNTALTPKELAQLPPVVRSNIRMLGDAVYPYGMNDEAKSLLQAWDWAQSKFKFFAYGVKPASAPKQLVSNTLQAALVSGVKAFKAFDSRAALDAAGTILLQQKQRNALPTFFQDFFKKYGASDADFAIKMSLDRVVGTESLDNFSSNFKLVSNLGQKYDGDFLTDYAIKNGVIRGFDASGENTKIKIERILKNNSDSKAQVAGELAKFWRWPQLTEDYSRMMLFLNGVRMGYSPKEAVGLVNKALFDYARGLSYVEKNVIKRIVPFYTYQRFAVPFVFSQVAKKPGTALTGEKFVNLLQSLMTEDTLNPQEREVLGSSYLIEQPRVFSGFDKDGKAYFNVFNNMTPLDAMSLLVTDKEGNLDYKRTMEKTVLAQMTPYLKVPLETVVGKNFFTGKSLEYGGQVGRLDTKNVNESLRVLTHLDNNMPQSFKDLIGWERRVSQNGKETVYINPYLAYMSTSFVPGLKTWVFDPLDEGSTALESAMNLITGVKESSIDLKEQQHYKIKAEQKQIRDLQYRIRNARQRGSSSAYEKAKEDYQKYIQALQVSRAQPGEVRGQGLSLPNNVQQPEQQ